MKRTLTVLLSLLISGAAGALAEDKVPGSVVSLLQKKCTACHKGKYPPQGLSLEPNRVAAAIGAPSREMPDLRIIDPADPEASYLLKKVHGAKGIKGSQMPPTGSLAPEEIKTLENWILGLKKAPAPVSAAGAPDGGTEAPAPAADPVHRRPYDIPPFWGTLLINLPTTTTPDKGDVLLRISHRFADRVEEGFDDFFGLDSYANILLGVGYGITDTLAVSVARARTYKEFEFGADWLVVEQGKTGGLPFSAALHGGVSLATDASPDEVKFFGAVSLSTQITRRFSVLVEPALVTNADHWADNPQGTFAIGLGGRYMVFKDFSITAEWVPVVSGYKDVENGWGLGLEKKIGGHVFQVFFNNSLGETMAQYLPGGDLRLADFDFRIGFNIFRTF